MLEVLQKNYKNKYYNSKPAKNQDITDTLIGTHGTGHEVTDQSDLCRRLRMRD